MLPNKVFVFEMNANKTKLGVQVSNKQYIVGVTSYNHAKRIKRVASPNMKLSAMEGDQTVYLSKLCVPKQDEKVTECKITEMTMDSFMMLPVNKNIGVLLGMDLLRDNEEEIQFNTVVIDPVYNIDAYRQEMMI